mgnify:CR=1 FL=1
MAVSCVRCDSGIFSVITCKMHGYRGDERLPFSLVQEMGIFVGDRVYNYKTYIVVGSIIGVCCLILILFYLFGKNTWTTWILIGTLVMGLAQRLLWDFRRQYGRLDTEPDGS